jgi:hypothetical protein
MISSDILQIYHQAHLEKDHRVDTFLPAIPVELLGKRIKKPPGSRLLLNACKNSLLGSGH